MTLRTTALALVSAATAACAAVEFGPVKNYPNMGLMFPCVARAKADPLPLPVAYPYLIVGSDDLLREDRFSPYELWYGLQCCGRWRDERGNLLVLGRIANRLPLFEETYVSRWRFSEALVSDDNRINPRSDEHVDEWVATFVEAPVYEPEELKLNTLSLSEVRHYPCAASNTLVYAFRPRRVGNAEQADWFCATLTASNETDIAALREGFEEQFVGQLKLPSRGAKDEGVESARLDLSREGRPPPDQPDHPVRLEARKSVENYDAWWVAETDGYIILSDVASDVGKSLVRDLQDQMPALRAAFRKLVPPLTQELDVSLIRLFQSKADYVRYVGAEQAWTSGVWMPARRELVLAQEANKDEMMRVIRHESFHQYLSHAYSMLPAAPWMNEGHACLFENASVDAKGRVALNEDSARVALLLANLDAAAALLPDLLQADYEGFYDAATAAERSLKYALAWCLAYYLQKGAPQERNTPYKEILTRFAAALAELRQYSTATALAWEGVDRAGFQENFREFWLKRRGAAMRYDPLE
jgi:hypothetical protein